MAPSRVWRIPLVALALAALAAPAAAAEHRLGVGAHYWRTIDDLEDEGFEIDDNGVAWLASYQYVPVGLIKLEADVEYFEKGFGGGTGASVSPQVFLVVGGSLYAAAGAGSVYTRRSGDGDEWSDVFFIARLGWDFTLLPRTHLDLNANYYFEAWDQLDRANTDSITLGAALRFAF